MTTLSNPISSESSKDITLSIAIRKGSLATSVSHDPFVFSKDRFGDAPSDLDLSYHQEEPILLEAPKSSNSNAWVFTDDDNFSVISQILLMTTALANADTEAYRTQAKMANENSNYAARLGPIIKTMVLTNWENQAASTRCDASKAKTAGITACISGVVGIGMGAWAHYGEVSTDATKAALTKTTGQLENTAETAGSAAARQGSALTEAGTAGAAVGATGSGTTSRATAAAGTGVAGPVTGTGAAAIGTGGADATATAEAATEATTGGLKKGLTKGASKLKDILKAGQIINKVMLGIQSAHALGEGPSKLLGDAKYDLEKAGYQLEVGQADATEKLTSSLQGVATSSGQRMNEASGQSQKGHGEALSSLQRVSADLTQAICAALRA